MYIHCNKVVFSDIILYQAVRHVSSFVSCIEIKIKKAHIAGMFKIDDYLFKGHCDMHTIVI